MCTLNGCPQRLPRLLAVPLVDISCAAATTAHMLRGGPYLQRAQPDAMRPTRRLVTITTGGNDVRYVVDCRSGPRRTAGRPPAG